MRCLAAAIPKTARPETTLTTASVMSSCIIEKPRWAFGFCFLVVRVVALITPPLWDFGVSAKLSRGPGCNDHASRGSLGIPSISRGRWWGEGGLTVTEGNACGNGFTQ